MSIMKVFYDNKIAIFDQKVNEKVMASLMDSYSTAILINDKPLLRHFLWNNGKFMLMQTS